jgi:hypothetical protein
MLKRNLVAVVVAALGITAGAAAFANAQTEEAPTSPPEEGRVEGQQPERQRKEGRRMEGRRGPNVIGRAVHGDVIVRTGEGTFEEVTFDKGTVEAIDADSITVVRPDGPEVTLAIDDGTRFRGDERPTVGQRVLVLSKEGVARMVAGPKRR